MGKKNVQTFETNKGNINSLNNAIDGALIAEHEIMKAQNIDNAVCSRIALNISNDLSNAGVQARPIPMHIAAPIGGGGHMILAYTTGNGKYYANDFLVPKSVELKGAKDMLDASRMAPMHRPYTLNPGTASVSTLDGKLGYHESSIGDLVAKDFDKNRDTLRVPFTMMNGDSTSNLNLSKSNGLSEGLDISGKKGYHPNFGNFSSISLNGAVGLSADVGKGNTLKIKAEGAYDEVRTNYVNHKAGFEKNGEYSQLAGRFTAMDVFPPLKLSEKLSVEPFAGGSVGGFVVTPTGNTKQLYEEYKSGTAIGFNDLDHYASAFTGAKATYGDNQNNVSFSAYAAPRVVQDRNLLHTKFAVIPEFVAGGNVNFHNETKKSGYNLKSDLDLSVVNVNAKSYDRTNATLTSSVEVQKNKDSLKAFGQLEHRTTSFEGLSDKNIELKEKLGLTYARDLGASTKVGVSATYSAYNPGIGAFITTKL
jgi:hypothetical protein